MLNLLNNARDAVGGSHDKRIRVSSRVEGASVFLTVEDSGPGMPEALEERIFEPVLHDEGGGRGDGAWSLYRLTGSSRTMTGQVSRRYHDQRGAPRD